MTFDEWVERYEGTKIDYDKTYGVQCVDLVKHFVDKVLGVYPQAIGNAIDYYYKRNSEDYLTDNFDWYDNTPEFVPQKGDIVVFKSQSPKGHIAVCNGVGDTHTFQAYDENYNGTHAGMTLRDWAYSGKRTVLGFHRPKDQSQINSTDGWRIDEYGWYFVENGKAITNQWKQDSFGWLYLGNDGYAVKSQWQEDTIDWCYLDAEGYMITNAWVQDSQGWCFIKNDGHILRNGYAWDSTGKHYLDDTGHMTW